MRNSRAREFYQDFMAETDEDAAEMIYRAYLQALRDGDEKADPHLEELESEAVLEADDDGDAPVEDYDDFDFPIRIEVA